MNKSLFDIMPSAEPAAASAAPAPLSVSQLNALARELLETEFSGLWVGGEVSNLTRAASGHWYFSLKDERAQVRCVMFKSTADKLALPLAAGDLIEVSGRVGIFEARGEFQITVSAVRRAGMGALFEAFEKLKAKLLAEGLFDEARKRPLPVLARRIGVVTSLAAAALRDVLTTLKRRLPAVQVVVYPTAVQGRGSELQIAQAIDKAAQRAEVEVLIVCRGGGSMEDLWAFNEEAVVRAISRCPMPVISGVGHETDFTLSDFAADVRAPTPTAAAELAVVDAAALSGFLEEQQTRLFTLLTRHWDNQRQRLDWLASRLVHPHTRIDRQRQMLEQSAHRLAQAAAHHLHRAQWRFERSHDLWRHHMPRPQTQWQRLAHMEQRLGQLVQSRLHHQQQRFQGAAAVLAALSPQEVLARGYSIVKDAQNHVVSSNQRLKLGQRLTITFADGETAVQVSERNTQQDLFEIH